MRASVVLLAVALAVPAAAQETFPPPDLDGCQTSQAYVWVDLAPGATWEATVDLSRCAPEDLGLFLYYGYVASKNRSTVIGSGDGIALAVEQGGLVVASSAGVTGALYLPVRVTAPGTVRLTATNTGKRAVKIRTRWQRVEP